MRRVSLMSAAMLTACLTSACSSDRGESGPASSSARGPGFAVEGSLSSGFTVYLYRFTASANGGGAVVQLHPAGGAVSVTISDPGHADGELLACPVQVGGGDHPLTGARCEELRSKGPTAISLPGGDGLTHVAFLITSSSKTLTINQAEVSYTPADNFLGVEFPGCCGQSS
jgi:hypothetical protein